MSDSWFLSSHLLYLTHPGILQITADSSFQLHFTVCFYCTSFQRSLQISHLFSQSGHSRRAEHMLSGRRKPRDLPDPWNPTWSSLPNSFRSQTGLCPVYLLFLSPILVMVFDYLQVYYYLILMLKLLLLLCSLPIHSTEKSFRINGHVQNIAMPGLETVMLPMPKTLH